MYRSLVIKCLQLGQLRKEALSPCQAWSNSLKHCHWGRQLSTTHIYWKKRKSVEEKVAEQIVEKRGRQLIKYSIKNEVVGIWRNMTVKQVADVLKKDINDVYEALEFADKESDIRYRANTVLRDLQIIRDIVKICGCRFKMVAAPTDQEAEEESKDAVPAPPAPAARLRPRPPVVCVMGHVDHGKTTLLDALRGARHVDTEFGGITQHIGAFQVPVGSSKITFLDTPGHAAFTAMRARGAMGADLVTLVVAADDGVMEQTRQSVELCGKVPIIVAINKIDKPGVKIERVLNELAAIGIVCEQLGGDVQAVPVSALKKLHLQDLLEALMAQAQLMEIKADYDGLVEGSIIEARIDPKLGKQATVLVSRGTLRRGDVLVAGRAWGKVRLLHSEEGAALEEVLPAQAALVSGWKELPRPGDLLLQVPNEKRASEVMRYRHQLHMRNKQEEDLPAIEERESEHREKYLSELKARRMRGIHKDKKRRTVAASDSEVEEEVPTLSVVVKGDVEGSVEALVEMLYTYGDPRVKLSLVHSATGQLTLNDIEIAKSFNATIYLFNVPAEEALLASAKEDNVEVKSFQVLYRLQEDVKQKLWELVPERQEEDVLGEANVLQQFFVSEGKKKVPVAGSRCVKGSLKKDALYRLVRAGEVLYEGKLASMKHLKEEVSSIKRDQECGLRLEDPSIAVKPGDSLVCFTRRPVRDPPVWDPGF